MSYVRKRLENFIPHKIRRKEIPKANGGVRPLGIPTMKTELYINVLSKFLNQYVKRNFIITVMGLDQIEMQNMLLLELCHL